MRVGCAGYEKYGSRIGRFLASSWPAFRQIHCYWMTGEQCLIIWRRFGARGARDPDRFELRAGAHAVVLLPGRAVTRACDVPIHATSPSMRGPARLALLERGVPERAARRRVDHVCPAATTHSCTSSPLHSGESRSSSACVDMRSGRRSLPTHASMVWPSAICRASPSTCRSTR